MKKIVYGIFIFLFSSTLVNASNKIYNIDMDIYLDEQGNANITEIWDVKGSNETEWYKGYGNVGQMQVKDFTVSMDGKELKERYWWDVNQSLEEKKGYYGINKTNIGFELCFGKYDYYRHRFTLKYTLTNVIFNTDDSQVLYNTFIDRLSSVKFHDFHVKISSYYSFSDDLDVWGYGYKGFAYVKNGAIEASNDTIMNDNFVVLLVKFPAGTFNTEINYKQYKTFNDVYTTAEKNTFKYDYKEKTNIFTNSTFISLMPFIMYGFVFIIIIVQFIVSRPVNYNYRDDLYRRKYGYKDNKVISKTETSLFRGIPCDKDIYYANALAKLNKSLFSNYKNENIFGAVLLKWVKEDKVRFIKDETGKAINKNKCSIDLTKEPKFDNNLEKELYNMMYKASKDGILEMKEFDKWAEKNYNAYLNLFDKFNREKINELEKEGHIYKRKDRKECKKKNVMDDMIYNETVKLYGLECFLEEFSKINTKEVIEVKLWDEYLMFAYIFGIAEEVEMQLKTLYPEVAQEFKNLNFDYDTLVLINNISNSSIDRAFRARHIAENKGSLKSSSWSSAKSYRSGGGGFSSGGGGGGSFGRGGGGGSR